MVWLRRSSTWPSSIPARLRRRRRRRLLSSRLHSQPMCLAVPLLSAYCIARVGWLSPAFVSRSLDRAVLALRLSLAIGVLSLSDRRRREHAVDAPGESARWHHAREPSSGVESCASGPGACSADDRLAFVDHAAIARPDATTAARSRASPDASSPSWPYSRARIQVRDAARAGTQSSRGLAGAHRPRAGEAAQAARGQQAPAPFARNAARPPAQDKS